MNYFHTSKAVLVILAFTKLTSQHDYEEVDDSTSKPTTITTVDPIAQWVIDQQKAEKERTREILMSIAEREGPEHPLCDFYCNLFNLCIQNEELQPLCGKPIGCTCPGEEDLRI
ncbi:hypothetical protein V3C99_014933 [Haemonchus contortus]